MHLEGDTNHIRMQACGLVLAQVVEIAKLTISEEMALVFALSYILVTLHDLMYKLLPQFMVILLAGHTLRFMEKVILAFVWSLSNLFNTYNFIRG